jgi:hypothetical protein
MFVHRLRNSVELVYDSNTIQITPTTHTFWRTSSASSFCLNATTLLIFSQNRRTSREILLQIFFEAMISSYGMKGVSELSATAARKRRDILTLDFLSFRASLVL